MIGGGPPSGRRHHKFAKSILPTRRGATHGAAADDTFTSMAASNETLPNAYWVEVGDKVHAPGVAVNKLMNLYKHYLPESTGPMPKLDNQDQAKTQHNGPVTEGERSA